MVAIMTAAISCGPVGGCPRVGVWRRQAKEHSKEAGTLPQEATDALWVQVSDDYAVLLGEVAIKHGPKHVALQSQDHLMRLEGCTLAWEMRALNRELHISKVAGLERLR
ncbi:hypothetical protein HPB49_013645 [Dermacentor silvarum]|uniref:Uncharacterized protein n=1 Tax=Dermacentor silvarum TaxID=543639 RepID=A0ACB8CRM4_DERSI|nr:hypothetical protein HPB49_013645 [Dermacentor silvarum]